MTPQKVLDSYDLAPKEKELMERLNMTALNAKARIYDLQVELENARTQLSSAQQAFAGALTQLGNSHGIANPGISQGLDRIFQQPLLQPPQPMRLAPRPEEEKR